MIEVKLPKIGMAMQEAILVKWYFEEGEKIEKGDPLFDFETEKVVSTHESEVFGILKEKCFDEGDTIEVGDVIAIIDERKGEEFNNDSKKEEKTESAGDEKSSYNAEIPMNNIRKVIGNRMLESWNTIPQFTLNKKIIVDSLVQEKIRLKQKNNSVTFNDLIIYHVSRTLLKNPLVYSRIEGDSIKKPEHINIGIAVASENGLIVPVLKNADKKDLSKISKESKELIDRVKKGKHTQEDISGGVFTISNLGSFGIDYFTPIINPSESAILGIGSIEKTSVIRDDEICIAHVLFVSLTVDHRLIDGAEGANFLNSLSAQIEKTIT